MKLQDLIIKSQLVPPRLHKGVLHRPRIDALLSSVLDFPLTILQAGTGYGKSTALAGLGDSIGQLYWYSIIEPDRDPFLFYLHLISAFKEHGSTAFAAVESNGGGVPPSSLNPLLNELVTELKDDSVLVLDDYHLVSGVKEIDGFIRKLIDQCPPKLHVIIASRHMPDFPDLNRWRMKNKVQVIQASELSFTKEEIERLFCDQYHYPISAAQAQTLAEETEGWVMALQIVWQSLQSGIVPDLQTALKHLPGTLDSLFDYLAPEVLARQPSYTQKFLLTTSVLRKMTSPVCDALLDTHDGQSTLRRLHEIGLFVESIGDDVYSYQRLFHDFLQNQLHKNPVLYLSLHRKAADFFHEQGQLEEELYHLLEARDFNRAVDSLEQMGTNLLQTSRLETLSNWINQLPKEVSKNRPGLDLIIGNLYRLRADFETALKYFVNAGHLFEQQKNYYGKSQALRNQAQVYLDTIRPLKAEALLEEALHLLEPQEYRQEAAELLLLLAENKLNSGYPDQAASLLQEARLLQAETNPNDIYLHARALLRTGRLPEARDLLLDQGDDNINANPNRPQRFHREKNMLLSLIYIMLGDAEAAEKQAWEGIRIGEQLHSDFVEAVGYMRLGHAVQLNSFYPWGQHRIQKAIQWYLLSMEKVRPFKVARVGVEPSWGLCRLYGYSGVVSTAEPYAEKALQIAKLAGDEWIGNLVRISMGAGYAIAGQAQTSRRWLNEAEKGFTQVGDSFAWSAAKLWQALNEWWEKKVDASMNHLKQLLPVSREKGFDILFVSCTHLGLKDVQSAIPMLIEALHRNIESDYIQRLLGDSDIWSNSSHPGYTLWVRTLGAFYTWRGDVPIDNHDWQREKAKQLFQLLITFRGKWLQRDQIIDYLWPELPADAAARDFKVALNALSKAIEPNRPKDAQPFFVIRRGNTYRLHPHARIVLDTEYFEAFAQSSSQEQWLEALDLYEDDYLADSVYEDWATPERERLRRIMLQVTERLGESYLASRDWDKVLDTCQVALHHDEYYEPAFRLMMQAYAGQGNPSAVRELFTKYKVKLQSDLGVEPSGQMNALFEKLTQAKPV